MPRVKISDTDCVISTPVRPKSRGSISMAGIKNRPFLADAVMDAFTPFPMDWSIMLVITMNAFIGRITTDT